MTLSFSTQINGKPNYFIEKIWESFPDKMENYPIFLNAYFNKFRQLWDGREKRFEPYIKRNPKLHTIRKDEKNRWGAGCDIHFVINNRTPNRFQFAPVIKCKSVQKIEIRHLQTISGIIKIVNIDGKQPSWNAIEQLAINDGFDSAEDFFAYFNKDFTGNIVHWSDLKY